MGAHNQDAANSFLHMAVGLQGRRALHAKRARRALAGLCCWDPDLFSCTLPSNNVESAAFCQAPKAPSVEEFTFGIGTLFLEINVGLQGDMIARWYPRVVPCFGRRAFALCTHGILQVGLLGGQIT